MQESLIEAENYVIFENLNNNNILYENIFNTLHDFNEENKELLSKLNSHQKEIRFKRKNLEDVLKEEHDNLVLNVTENCNLRCGYCINSGLYENEHTYSKKRMNKEVARKAVDYFMANSEEKPLISFYGGEPLLNKELIKKVVNYVEENLSKEVEYRLTSNFTLNEGFMNFLKQNNFLLAISLDGPKEIHDKWRKFKKGKGTYEKILENIHSLKDNHRKYYEDYVGFSVTLTNPSNLLKVEKYFSQDLFRNNPITLLPVRKLGLKEDVFDWEKSLEEGKKQISYLSKKYVDNIINKKPNSTFLRGLFDGVVYPIWNLGNSEIKENLEVKNQCIPGFRKLMVGIDGSYYMCEKVGKRMKIGNTKQGLDSEEILKWYNNYVDIKNELCPECWTIRICDSCAASALDKKIISKEGQLSTCKSLQSKIIDGLSIYSSIVENDKNKNYEEYFSSIDMGGVSR